MEIREIESAVEGILFAAGEPVPVKRIADVLGIDSDTVRQVTRKLADTYQFERRGMRILFLDDALQMCSAPEHADLIRRTLETRKPPQLSQPALEVLAIIAYYQPATRAFVEQVRGVDSSYTVGLLADRGLIEACGRLAVPGRPRVYRTTDAFLRAFHLSSLEELPDLPEGEEQEGQMKIQAAIEKLRSEQVIEALPADEQGEAPAQQEDVEA